MALFVKQNEERSELQQKIAAGIAERQRAAAQNAATPPDGVDDSTLIEGTSHMTKIGLVLLILLVTAFAAVLIFLATH